MSAIEHFWAVVPAGGAGTRLWPLSRSASPKFLHDLTGSGRSLLQETVARVAGTAEDRVLVVTGAAHRDQVVAQLPHLPAEQVVAEPSPRDSMAAIGYAAALLERDDPDAVMASFAADHVIGDLDLFEQAVALAAEVARDDWLVTVGIRPTGPSTAFGYVRQGAALRRPRRCVRGRGVRGEAVRRGGPELRRSRHLPLERRDVRRTTRACCSTCSAPCTRASPRRSATSRRLRTGSRRSGRPCRRSPSTTRWPSPPLRGPGRDGAGRVRLGRHR